MVSFTTTATVTLVTFAAMIQPSIQAAQALKIGAQVVGGVISGSQDNNNRRATTDPSTGPFAKCLSDAHTQGARLFLHKEDHSAMLTNVPQSCIDAANEVNKLPNIKDIEKTQGTITVVGKNSVKLSGVEGEVQKMLEEAATKTVSKTASKTAAPPKGNTKPTTSAKPSQ